MTEMHISSLVVHVRPERLSEVRRAILAAGGEIPALDPAGKIVAVLESDSEADITSFANALAVRDGVLSANLVFHLIDDLSAGPDGSAEPGGSA